MLKMRSPSTDELYVMIRMKFHQQVRLLSIDQNICYVNVKRERTYKKADTK